MTNSFACPDIHRSCIPRKKKWSSANFTAVFSTQISSYTKGKELFMAQDASKQPVRPPFYEERVHFKNQLFEKKLPPPKGNTTYEELACIGFQPELNQLQAVVYIKQPVGYLGDICSAGSQEYVRFFLSYDKGKSWHDAGMTQFTAYDVPETAKHRLEYAVTLSINPRKHLCKVHNFVMVRAILSWQVPPHQGNPDFPIYWGNAKETVIQIAPTRRLPLKDIVDLAKLKFPPEIADVLDFEQEIETVESKPLTLAQLHAMYEGNVEPHRFGFPAVLKMQDDPKVLTAAAMNLPSVADDVPFSIGDVLKMLVEPKGDTSYEQLDCVGYDPRHKQLVATFRVKRGFGYSGGPCTPGSVEYVTFWGDFNNNGLYETCLGTIGLRVHDFARIPEHGLEYGVALPVDLTKYQQPCEAGPKFAGIRAMLSWHVPHPCNSPDKPPVWGNAEDTVILIPAGQAHDPQKQDDGYLYTVCGVNICAIDPATGLTKADDQPFGGTLNITGEIPAATALPKQFQYQVKVRSMDPVPGAWQALKNDFGIWVTEGSGGGIPSTSYVTQHPDPAGWYDYPEYGNPMSGNWRRVTGPDRLLGVWGTVASQTGRWEIGLNFRIAPAGAEYWAQVQHCSDGSSPTNATVYLDQVRPDAILDPNLEVSTDSGATWSPAVACDTFVKGVWIRGKYTVSDEHFRILSLYVQPSGPAHGAAVSPSLRTYPTVPTTGETGTWTLDTSGMDPCGYVVRLDVWDRTIVSCDDDGWFNWASLGFCLKAKDTEK
jgi:hypothetical protein